jgi:protein gp37
MSDLFHQKVPSDFILEVLSACSSRPDVTFQILTKRPNRAVRLLEEADTALPPNVLMGVSVENNDYLWRLRAISGTKKILKKFVSFEPLLGPVQLDWSARCLDWAIIGGESGPHFRKMDESWALELAFQLKQRSIPLFVKQMGGRFPGGDVTTFPAALRLREFPFTVERMA